MRSLLYKQKSLRRVRLFTYSICVHLHLIGCVWGGFLFPPLCALCSVQEEQLLSHESKLKQMSLELEEHRKNSPSDDPKSREWEEFRLKEHYLTYEVQIYSFLFNYFRVILFRILLLKGTM